MSWENGRVQKYNNITWVHDNAMVNRVLQHCSWKGKKVLDVGAGTGALSVPAARLGADIVAIDINKKMLSSMPEQPNIHTFVVDAESDGYRNFGKFDIVLARMVVHHLNDVNKWLANTVSNMVVGGEILIVEGIPPQGCYDWFCNMFREKEQRTTYTADSIVRILEGEGYSVLAVDVFSSYENSLNNWLENDAELSEEARSKIYEIHHNAPEYVKQAYEMTEKNNDIYMTWKHVIVKGVL